MKLNIHSQTMVICIRLKYEEIPEKEIHFFFILIPVTPQYHIMDISTVKPVQNGLSKKDRIKIYLTNGSFMKVESIAECFA